MEWDVGNEKYWLYILDVIDIIEQPDYTKVKKYWKWLKKANERGQSVG
jgi:hypothetical protein